MWQGLRGPSGKGKTQQQEAKTAIHIKLDSLTTRVAFSYIPFLQTLTWMVQKMVLQPSPGNIAANSSSYKPAAMVGILCFFANGRLQMSY